MVELELAIIWGLAGWRVASLLVNEDGPWESLERLRQLIGLKPGPIEGFLPKLFSCIWCMSVWTTALAALVWEISPTAVIITAGAAIALLVDKVVNGGSH